MFKILILLFSVNLLMSSNLLASDCSYGSFLGVLDAHEFVTKFSADSSMTEYRPEQAHSIHGVLAEQIKKTFGSASVAEALAVTDDALIYEFEIPSSAESSYEKLTVLYATMGDTLVGAVFVHHSATVIAKLSDGDILVCH